MLVTYIFDSVILGTLSLLEFVLKERWKLSEKKIEQFCERVSVWICVCAGSLPDSHEIPHESKYCRHVYNLTC